MSSPMQPIIESRRRKPPPRGISPGSPRWAVFYANYRFVKPGIHVWTGKRNVRVLPLPKRWAR